MKRKNARLRRVGRIGYQISSQGQVKLQKDLGLDGAVVEELLVETSGAARLRKGDVVLRRAEVFTRTDPV